MKLFIYFWLFVIGAMMGSFLGCMGYRIPNKIKTTYPSSFCPNCKKPLKWYMNIPILSYILLDGKCKYCHKKIGIIYFLTEIITALLFVFNYFMFGFNINFFISIILTCILTVTIVSDFEYYYISDRVLLIGYVFLLIVLYYFDTDILFTNTVSSIVIFLVMYGIKILGNSMFKKESLGDGDIKLMGVIALGLGITNSFVSLFFSSLVALIFSLIIMRKNKDGLIPFGPFLLLGALIVLYIGNYITPFLDEIISI